MLLVERLAVRDFHPPLEQRSRNKTRGNLLMSSCRLARVSLVSRWARTRELVKQAWTMVNLARLPSNDPHYLEYEQSSNH